MSAMKDTGISVVMPSYNAAGWLPTTIGKIETAITNSGVPLSKTEIVLVDDGSSDNTRQVVDEIKKTTKVKITFVSQKNQGRYLTRKNGVERAKFPYVWFVDTRVHVTPMSLKYAISEIAKGKENAVWNAHVNVHKKGNIIARFMDAITFIGWRKYFKNPRRCSYGLKEFDYFPKGTTSFLVPKKLIVDAMAEFEQEEHDMQRSSDDTHLIRIIARDHPINLSPKFACKYHARNTFKAFIKHTYHRGQVFIDGFFRPGTRFYVPIIAFLVLSAALVVSVAVAPSLIPHLLLIFVVLWLSELLAALLLGVAAKDALSLFLLSPVFAVVYGAGLWVAVTKKLWQDRMSKENRSKTLWVIGALLFFTVCTVFFYLGKSAAMCSTTLASGPGDQTGLIWLNSAVNAPLWGVTDVSNAPYGENLQSPTHITGALEYIFFWLASLAVGPICGYNLFTALSLIFSAMVVFFFTRSLTQRSDVAVFAGFAASFTPYLQIKTGVHPSYVFYGVFVLAIWLALRLWYRASVKTAIALGLVVASFFYIDPYFMLLGAVVVTATLFVFIGRLLYKLYEARAVARNYRLVVASARRFVGFVLISAGVAVIFGLLPLFMVKLQHGAQIDSEVGSVRSDIKVEANIYGARPAEYLPPNPFNPYLAKYSIQSPDLLTRKPHGSNAAENTLSLSLVVIVLATIAAAIAIKGERKRYLPARFGMLSREQRFAVGVLVFIAFIALLTSFLPRTHGLIFPSEIITSYVTIWRVLARLGVVVMFCLAIIAAIGLAALTTRLKGGKRHVIVGLAILVVGFEYLTFIPFHDNRSWSYDQVVPFYSWLKKRDDVDTIAEYPLNEPGRTSVSVAYFRDHYIHKKRLINAYTSASKQTVLRNGIRDLTDPQTASALASLGTDLVVVHAEDKKAIPVIPGFEFVDWNNDSHDPDSIYVDGKMWVYRVVAPKDADGLVLVPGKGFDDLARINSTYTEAGYAFKTKAYLSTIDLSTGKQTRPVGRYKVSFYASSVDRTPVLIVSQAGGQIVRISIPEQRQRIEFEVEGRLPIQLEKSGGNGSDGILITDIDMKKL